MAEVRIQGLLKRFGSVVAVDHIDLTIADGEFLTLLGPSGCGKSTTLAAVAGLDRPDGGSIRVGDTVFYDGASGEILVRAVDPKEARDNGRMMWQTSVTNRAEADRMLRKWAVLLREALDRARAQEVPAAATSH